MVKIWIVVEVCKSKDFFIIVWMDVWIGLGLDEVLCCCEVFWDVGGDILFLESFEFEKEFEEIGKVFFEIWFFVNMVEGGFIFFMFLDVLKDLGFFFVIYFLIGLIVVVIVLWEVYVDF